MRASAGHRSARVVVNDTIKEENTAAAAEATEADTVFKMIREVDESKRSEDEDIVLHSDDDTLGAYINYSSSEDEQSLRDGGKYLKRRRARHQYQDFNKEFKNEELKIKVRLLEPILYTF